MSPIGEIARVGGERIPRSLQEPSSSCVTTDRGQLVDGGRSERGPRGHTING